MDNIRDMPFITVEQVLRFRTAALDRIKELENTLANSVSAEFHNQKIEELEGFITELQDLYQP